MGQGGFWREIIYDPVCQPPLAKSWPGSPLLLKEGDLLSAHLDHAEGMPQM